MASPRTPPTGTNSQVASPDTPQVLIVDDDVTSLDLLQRGLRKAYGYEVRTAASALEGLALAQASRFDLLLVDLRLPDMSGIEMVRKLTDEHGPVAFVLFTGFADVPTTVEAMKLGAFTVLEKPVGLDDLGLVIEQALSDARCRVTTDPASPQPTCSVGEADRYAHAGTAGRVDSDALASSPGTISPEPPHPTRVKRRFRHDELFTLAECAIEANLSRTDLDLGVIANLLHVSRWRLSRAFSACGADYRACLRRARMRRAGQILREGRASSIKEVAVAVGYLYSTDFTKHFKKHWGMTPTAFWTTSSCRIRGLSNGS